MSCAQSVGRELPVGRLAGASERVDAAEGGLGPVAAQMHPGEPSLNLGDTSFLDGVAGPGLLVEEFADADHSKHVRDADGAPVPTAGGVYSVAGITHLALLSHHTILKGWYGVELVQAVAHV